MKLNPKNHPPGTRFLVQKKPYNKSPDEVEEKVVTGWSVNGLAWLNGQGAWSSSFPEVLDVVAAATSMPGPETLAAVIRVLQTAMRDHPELCVSAYDQSAVSMVCGWLQKRWQEMGEIESEGVDV